MRFVLCVFVSVCSLLTAEDKPLSVVIIGAGPVGLATAIEANRAGCDVTIIEKRDAYSRNQFLFLNDVTLASFQRWNVFLSEKDILNLKDGHQTGLLLINSLEKLLSEAVDALPVKRILGKFTDFKENEKKLLVSTMEGETEILYDVLVAADGIHSCIRKKLGISYNCLAKLRAGSAVMPLTHPDHEADMPLTMQKDGLFIRKLTTPQLSIIIIQDAHGTSMLLENILKVAKDHNWQEEVTSIERGDVNYFRDIPVSIEQAETFSDKERAVVLVGDASACACYIQGKGVNTGFESALLAGELFVDLQQHKEDPYERFNEKMKDSTDALIENSLFLIELPAGEEKE